MVYNHVTDNEINYSSDEDVAIALKYFGLNTNFPGSEIFFGSGYAYSAGKQSFQQKFGEFGESFI